jgi:hypothetical protein
MPIVDQCSAAELQAGLEHILGSPKEGGSIDMIVRRPQVNEREILQDGELDTSMGLIGDNWLQKGYRKTADGSAHPDMQINLMNTRVISLVAGGRQHWSLAGDQFFVDMDLSDENLPARTRLQIGSATLEITAEPHLGCKKFTERFGVEAMKFVNSSLGKKLNLRGINAKVVKSGSVSTGAVIKKLAQD